MSQPGGQWGTAKWGGSLWGWRQFKTAASGILLTEDLVAAINQDPPVALAIRARVYLNGTEVTDLIEYVGGSTDGLAQASMTFIGTQIPGLDKFADIRIDVEIDIGLLGTASGVMFSGDVQTISESKGASSQSTNVTCFGDLYRELQEEPINTEWTGTVFDLLASELAGLPQDIQIPGFSLSGFPINYSSKLALIRAIAGTTGTPIVYVDPDGVICVRVLEQESTLHTVEWETPLSGQTWQGPAADAVEHFNEVIVQGADGSTVTVVDTGDQATHGRIKGETIVLPMTSDSGVMTTRGEAAIAESMREAMIWETPLHPFLRVGDLITSVEQQEGGDLGPLLIDAITSWSFTPKDGGWMRMRGIQL